MKTTLALVALSLAAVGCASSNQDTAPTHRWATDAQVSQVQYRNDHARCQSAARIDSSTRELATSSPEYAAYSACMTTSGYELTAYNAPR